MKPLFCASFVLLSAALHAQEISFRAKEAYLRADKNFDVDCFYSQNKTFKLITPNGLTLKKLDSISRDFTIETADRKIPMSFTLTRKNKSFDYTVVLDGAHLSKAKLSTREFYIPRVQDENVEREFETSKIYCAVNFAYEAPYALKDGDYHISVHPQTIYDWQSLLKEPIEAYLNDNKYESIILLEADNNRGDLVNINHFLDGVNYQLEETSFDTELERVPSHIPLLVSPTGNNRFEIKASKELNITFTGGNHNYCMWNSARHVLEGLMNSKSEAKVRFIYDTKAIIAQARGMQGVGINFSSKSIKRSNLLKDLLSSPEVQATYHSAYLSYFRDYLAKEYSGMYKTYKIHYKAPGFETSLILQGLGHKNVEVSFTYL